MVRRSIQNYANRQGGIISMSRSEIVTSVADFQTLAEEKLSADSYGYYISGSDDQITLRNNISAFKQIYLTPRVLVDMSNVSMKTTILGQELSLPFGVAPFALQKILHPKGQLLSSAQAFKRNTAYCLSMLTTTKLSDIAKANPTGLKILQLYFMKNAQYTLDVIRLAEKQGFKALAITVDTQTFGKRRRDQRNVFSPRVTLQLFNQLGYNFKMRDVEDQSKSFVHQLRNDMSWEDILWIKQNTSLKIILKGVTSPEDVELAHKYGADAIWISNHGGRQLDTCPATILVLPAIRRKIIELNSKMELYIDGGVKTGSDIFKCLALGADFVFLGRGFLFSICFGEEGVNQAFNMLTSELKTTMMLCGANSIKSISSDFILKRPQAKL